MFKAQHLLSPAEVASQNQERNFQDVHAKLDEVSQSMKELDQTTGEGLAHTIKTLRDTKEVISQKRFPKEMKVKIDGISVMTLKGDKGDKGIQGIQGIKGDKGEVGDSGQSIKGDQGETGPQGPKGEKGETGSVGPDGKSITGKNGKDGKDGKDGSPDTGDEIVEKINEAEKHIKPEAITGLEDALKYVDRVQRNPVGGGGGAGGPNLIIKNQGTRVSDLVTALNFSTNLSATYANNGQVTITATSGSGITQSINVVAVNTTAAAAASTNYTYLFTSNKTLTMPTAVGNTNIYTVKNVSSGTVTIAFNGAETGDGSATLSLPVKYTSLDLISDGTNWNII